MTGLGLTFLILSIVIVWGGMLASILVLSRRPEVAAYPPGAPEDHREDAGIIEHDT